MSKIKNIISYIIDLFQKEKYTKIGVNTRDYKSKFMIPDHGVEAAYWQIQRFANQKEYENYLEKGVLSVRIEEENMNLFNVEKAITEINAEFLPAEGNLLLKEGITNLLSLICLSGGTKWDNANARIGVGDSTIEEVDTQTGLQATTNKAYKSMDSHYPQVSNKTATWKATFGAAAANFAWNEFTVTTAAEDTGYSLCRKVNDQGTKTEGQIWTCMYTLTMS